MNIRQYGAISDIAWQFSHAVEGCQSDHEREHFQEMCSWLENTFGPPSSNHTSNKVWDHSSYKFSTSNGGSGFTWALYFYNEDAVPMFLLRWS